MKVGNPDDFIKGTYKRSPKKINFKPVIYITIFLSLILMMCIMGALISAIMNEDKPYKPYNGPEGGYYLTEDNIPCINGDHIKVSLNTDKIIILGHHNEIIINNDNVSLITITGLENTVYYPINSNPKIVIEGMENKCIKMEW